MLQKSGKGKSGFFKFVSSGAKILFVAEAAAFGVTYLIWHRLNTSRGKLSNSKRELLNQLVDRILFSQMES